MSLLLNSIGWKYMTTGDLIFMFCMAGGVFLVMAYLTDVLLERLSFGIIMNTILLMAGAIFGLVVLSWLGYAPTRRNFIPAIFACGMSSVLFIIVLAAMKRPA